MFSIKMIKRIYLLCGW